MGPPPQQDAGGACGETGFHTRVLPSAAPLPLLPSALPPLSHLRRWRTSEDSSVISPKLLLRRHGATSSSSSTTSTRAQTPISA